MNSDDLLNMSKSDFMRTKIIASIKSLVKSGTPFSKLSITEICRHAGISRSSFYHVFDDINQALSWDSAQSLSHALKESSGLGSWRDVLAGQTRANLEHLLTDPEYYTQLHREMSHVDYSSVYLATRRLRVEWFEEIIGDCSEEILFEIDFFVYGESNSVASWAARGMKEPPEEVARRIVGCIPRGLEESLEKSYSAHFEKPAPSENARP